MKTLSILAVLSVCLFPRQACANGDVIVPIGTRAILHEYDRLQQGLPPADHFDPATGVHSRSFGEYHAQWTEAAVVLRRETPEGFFQVHYFLEDINNSAHQPPAWMVKRQFSKSGYDYGPQDAADIQSGRLIQTWGNHQMRMSTEEAAILAAWGIGEL